jgi:hypothetical protein
LQTIAAEAVVAVIASMPAPSSAAVVMNFINSPLIADRTVSKRERGIMVSGEGAACQFVKDMNDR